MSHLSRDRVWRLTGFELLQLRLRLAQEDPDVRVADKAVASKVWMSHLREPDTPTVPPFPGSRVTKSASSWARWWGGSARQGKTTTSARCVAAYSAITRVHWTSRLDASSQRTYQSAYE